MATLRSYQPPPLLVAQVFRPVFAWRKPGALSIGVGDHNERIRKWNYDSLRSIRSGVLIIEPNSIAVRYNRVLQCLPEKFAAKSTASGTPSGPAASIGVTSATIAHLTAEKLSELRVPLRPVKLQREFADKLSRVEQIKATQTAALGRLNALFASLQHRAFRGEL